MNLVITSLGMVTAIGHDVVTASAAFRAGMVRARELEYYMANDEPAGDDQPVQGHPIAGLVEGFEDLGLWIRLSQLCLEDLIRYGQLPDKADRAFWSRAGLIVAVPFVLEDRFLLPEDEIEATLRPSFLEPLMDLVGVRMSTDVVRVVEQGHCGITVAVQDAQALMKAGTIDRAVVLGVDSYMHPRSLDWLVESGSLKTPTQLDGTLPGEAAACFLVEEQEQATRRHAVPQARIVGASVRGEIEYEVLDPVLIARDLASAIRDVHALTEESVPLTCDVLLDLNGEFWKAEIWGQTQPQISSLIDFEHSRALLPCTSFGETGAASGALAICLATRAFTRGYATGSYALICSLNDIGDAAALILAPYRA